MVTRLTSAVGAMATAPRLTGYISMFRVLILAAAAVALGGPSRNAPHRSRDVAPSKPDTRMPNRDAGRPRDRDIWRGRATPHALKQISRLRRHRTTRVDANVEPVSCGFEPSLFDHNTDIENSRPETGPRNRLLTAINSEKLRPRDSTMWR